MHDNQALPDILKYLAGETIKCYSVEGVGTPLPHLMVSFARPLWGWGTFECCDTSHPDLNLGVLYALAEYTGNSLLFQRILVNL